MAAIDRRAAGVLLEKAKTTPDAYPMTLNAIRTGCNQKNNRYPLMEVELHDLQESLDRLRALGAIGEVHGSSRTAKYRHHLYEWLGVDKVEMAVMAELLLRGTQTEGELRGPGRPHGADHRCGGPAARIEFPESEGPGYFLNAPGRGHVVTHALYEPREMEKVRREFEHVRMTDIDSLAATEDEPAAREVPAEMPTPRASQPAATEPRTASGPNSPAACAPVSPASAAVLDAVAALSAQMVEVQAELARLRKDIDGLWAEFR